MAKVTGPLMSMNARGQLGKTLVFMGWKGLKTIRSFVIPANPQSAGQTTQRGYFTAAVALYHTSTMTGADKTAWDLFAKGFSKAMSGFNAFCKGYVDAVVAAKAFLLMWGGDDVSVTGGQVELEINTTTGKACKVRYGESATSLINTDDMVEDGATGKYELTVASLVAGDKFYCQFYLTDVANLGTESGVYEFTVAS